MDAPAAPCPSLNTRLTQIQACWVNLAACRASVRAARGTFISTFAGGFEYADAVKAKGDQTWTDANLEAFLKAPNEFAPGTKMQMAVTDDANRAAIIAYLKTLK